ncbi:MULTISPECIES: GNAT family N-acetyltransferase [Chitinophagaceae]
MQDAIQFQHIQASDDARLSVLIKRIFEEFGIDIPGTVYTDPTTDHLSDLFKTPGSIYWVAKEKGNILGGCGIFPTDGLPDGYGELVKLYLSPVARGKGIGKALLEKTFDSAKALGYTHLYLESFPQLAKAVSMYEKSGFVKLPHALGNSGHYACNIWMEKEL